MMRTVQPIVAVLVMGILSTSLEVACQAAEPHAGPPFVAGFERFSRHGDIDPVTSGRLLLSELSCVACHASSDKMLEPKGGPNLERAGLVLRRKWIVQFLADPQRAKPGTTMPNVLSTVDASEKNAVVDALATYIVSLEKPFWEVRGSGALPVLHEFWNQGNVDRGLELYHQVGCVACHEPSPDYKAVVSSDSPVDKLIDELDAEELEEMGLGAAARRVDSIPHSELSQKYTPQGLAMFLLDPHAFRTSGRMPSFKLQPSEAADLSAYLLAKQDPAELTSASPYDIDRIQTGRDWFVKLNCAQCHDPNVKAARPSFKPLAELDATVKRSCLSDSDQPLDFSLDDAQATAIVAALSELNTSADSNATLQHSTLQHSLLQMNCFACHERDGLGGVGRHRKPYFETVGSVDLGDEGRLPPPLTGAGRKLQPAWFKKVLRGDKADIRPHMHIRMPVFHPSLAETVPAQMAAADHASNASERDVFGSLDDLSSAGRTMMDVGCVQCHEFRGFALPGVVGVDLKGVTNRVRPEWFHSFILDPGSVKARTRMPTFFPDGKSQLSTEIYGDVDHQVAAIWSYLKQIDKEPLPEKVLEANSKSYELKPTNRPIILRTFMPEAGTHAIAVGFPDGVNFAFDAEKMRLASIWRGRFLDAQGTWFVRSAPPSLPLGEDLVQLPAIVPFFSSKDELETWPTHADGYRFKGYRLDASGIPTFLYSFADIDFEDRIVPAIGNGFDRSIKVVSKLNSSKLSWLALQEVAPKSNLKVSVGPVPGLEFRKIVLLGDKKVIATRVTLHSHAQLEITYRW